MICVLYHYNAIIIFEFDDYLRCVTARFLVPIIINSQIRVYGFPFHCLPVGIRMDRCEPIPYITNLASIAVHRAKYFDISYTVL